MWNYLFILDDNDNTQLYTPLKTLKESDWVLNSPSGKWTVTPDDTIICQEVGSNKYISSNNNLNACNSVVKRKLIFNKNTEKSGMYVVYCLMDI